MTLQNAQTPETYRQFSQEFRVASPIGGAFEYLAGLYFQTDELSNDLSFNFTRLNGAISGNPTFSALIPFLPLGQTIHFDQDEQSYSVFGSLTWNATDRLKLTAGLRGSWVDKEFDWALFYGTATQDYGGVVPLPDAIATLPNALGTGVATSLAGSRSDHAWMPSFRIQYEFDPNAMIYASYARGFKAGGFNYADITGVLENLPFEPEYVDAYEAGLKSEFFDRSVRLNLAVFRSEYSDLQTSASIANAAGTLISVVRNAASSISQGVEFEGQWVFSDNFRLSAHGTYLDSHYVSYPNASLTILQTFCRANPVIPECVAEFPAGVAVTQDLSGRPTQYAPQWSGSVTGAYDVDLPADYGLAAELSA